MMSTSKSPRLSKFMSAFGALQTVNDRRYPWARFRQKAVPNRGLAIFLTVAIVAGLVFPAPANEGASDPFEITRLNSTGMLLSSPYGTR
jgi:hypothetical protein